MERREEGRKKPRKVEEDEDERENLKGKKKRKERLHRLCKPKRRECGINGRDTTRRAGKREVERALES